MIFWYNWSELKGHTPILIQAQHSKLLKIAILYSHLGFSKILCSVWEQSAEHNKVNPASCTAAGWPQIYQNIHSSLLSFVCYACLRSVYDYNIFFSTYVSFSVGVRRRNWGWGRGGIWMIHTNLKVVPSISNFSDFCLHPQSFSLFSPSSPFFF